MLCALRGGRHLRAATTGRFRSMFGILGSSIKYAQSQFILTSACIISASLGGFAHYSYCALLDWIWPRPACTAASLEIEIRSLREQLAIGTSTGPGPLQSIGGFLIVLAF